MTNDYHQQKSVLDPALEEKMKKDMGVMRLMTTCSNCNQTLTSSTVISCLHSLCVSCLSQSLLHNDSMEDVDEDVQETTGKRPRSFQKTSPPSKKSRTGEGKDLLSGCCPLCSFQFTSSSDYQEYTIPDALVNQMRITEKILSGDLSADTLPTVPIACFSKTMCYKCTDEGQEILAVTKCDLCGDLYCQEHAQKHERILRTWGHTCSSFSNDVSPPSSHPSSSKLAKCPVHQKDLDSFCDDCLRFACSSCRSDCHSSHRFLPVSLHLISTVKTRFVRCLKALDDLRNDVTRSSSSDEIKERVRRTLQKEIDGERNRMDSIIALLSAFLPSPSKAKITLIVSGVFEKATEVLEERMTLLDDLTDSKEHDLENIERMKEFSSFFMNSLLLEGFQQLFPVFWRRLCWTTRCSSMKDQIRDRMKLEKKAKESLGVRDMISAALADTDDPDPNLAFSLRSLPALLKTISI